jgi:hypothetical protein
MLMLRMIMEMKVINVLLLPYSTFCKRKARTSKNSWKM